MMLRPATPLTLFFLVAFVLLLLSCLSTPVIHNVPLATWNGYNFGVFGYCEVVTGTDTCTPAQVGYPIAGIFSTTNDFTLPSDSRHALSSILVVHPVAAFMTLVCTLLGAALHFRGPSHSPRFLLALLILTFPTLLITLLAFLVDILLFIPHMAWGGWIVLAATIIITVCSVLTCAMRRTLVSRKARKKRIDENNDMNGENFYAMKQASGFTRAESPPPIQSQGTVTEFNARPAMPDHTRMSSTDDRRPLNPKESNLGTISTSEGPARDLTDATNTNISGSTAVTPVIAAAGAAAATAAYREGGASSTPDGMTDRSRDPRTDRDNRRAQQGPYRDGTPRSATRQTPQFGRGAYQPQSSRGMAPRAGYRGGYGPPGRGGPGPNYGQRGGYQPMPSPGWNGQGRGMPGQGPPGYGPGPYGAPPSQRQYDPNYMPQMPQPMPQPYGIQNAPIEPGQWNGETAQDDTNDATGAVIDAYDTGSPDMSTAPNYARRPSGGIERDPASFGFSGRRSPARGSGLPRSTSPIPPVPSHKEASPEAVELDSAPLMAAPQGGASELEGRGAVHELQGASFTPSTWRNEPVELGDNTDLASSTPHHQIPRAPIELPAEVVTSPLQPITSHTRSASSNYHEDVPAAFAADEPIMPPPPQPLNPLNTSSLGAIPAHLLANSSHSSGGSGGRYASSAYDDPNGPDRDRTLANRSPAVSETSNFTSISQRPVNPSWQPPPGSQMMGPGPGPGYYPAQGRGGWNGPVGSPLAGPGGGYPVAGPSGGGMGYQSSSIYSGPGKSTSRYRDQETVLNANPDFALPGSAGKPGRRRAPSGGVMDRPRPGGPHSRGASAGSGGFGRQYSEGL